MAVDSPPPPPVSSSKSSKRKNSKKRKHGSQDAEIDQFDELPWNSSLPIDEDGAYSLIIGSNDLEGGFLSLEEINEADYGLEIPKPHKEKTEKAKKLKTQKHHNSEEDIFVKDEVEVDEDAEGEKKTKKKKKKKRKKAKKTQKAEELLPG